MLADDIVQESMKKALSSFHSLKDDSKLMAWTCRIMLNCYRDWLRRQKDHVDIDEHELADQSTPLHHVAATETAEFVRHCINKLSEKHRNVITLVDLMGFSYEEVSVAVDIPIGTVMSRLCRGRTQLKKFLEEKNRHDISTDTVNLRRVK